ncbi:TPA: ead/Ea22-like family protein [Enterobacter roggenkampii]
MSNIDKHALREAAEKATPGPWGIARNGKTITSNQSHPVAVVTEDFHRLLANGKTGGDAEFIAAANPATVLALLDELEAAEKRIAELERKEQHSERQSVIDALASSGEEWSDIEEYMQKWDAERASAAGKGE